MAKIRTNIGQRKPTIEDVYHELKAIQTTLNELVVEVKAIKEKLPADFE